MRLTSRKKEILSYFDPDNRAWVTGEITGNVAALCKMVCCLAGGTADDTAPRGVFRRVLFWLGLCAGGGRRVRSVRPAGGSCVFLPLPSGEVVRAFSVAPCFYRCRPQCGKGKD